MVQSNMNKKGFIGIKLFIASFSLISTIGLYTLIALNHDIDEESSEKKENGNREQAPLPTIIPVVNVSSDLQSFNVDNGDAGTPKPTAQPNPPEIETVIIQSNSGGSSGSTVTSSSR